MKRRLVNLLRRVSFGSSILLLAIFPLNFFIWAGGHWNGTQSNFVFFINNGCVSVIYQRGPGMAAFVKKASGANTHRMQVFRADQSQTRLYLWQNVRRALLPEYRVFSDYPPPNPASAIWSDGIYVPIWWLAGLCAIPWIWTLIRRLRAHPPGHCPNCGYDLRASPGRCPECGTEDIRAESHYLDC